MIATLTGKIDSVSGESCIIDVNGVGYRVFMALSALEALSRSGAETVKIYTHFHLREDGANLFGFLTPADKSVFEKIIGVSGVGPKTALTIIGVLTGEGFQEAIMNEDHQTLTRVSGVGLKTAQRLVLELKGKITRGYAASNGVLTASPPRYTAMADAVDALSALGYPAKEAAAAVEELYRNEPALTTPELVRKALKNLGGK